MEAQVKNTKVCKTNKCQTKVGRNMYCEVCIKERKRKTSTESSRKKRESNQKLCEECKKVYTGTKYCNPCSQKVRARKLNEYKKKAKGLCHECKCDISHKPKHTKYCDKCKDIIAIRQYEKRKIHNREDTADRKAGIENRNPTNPKYLHRNCNTYEGYNNLNGK